MIVESTDDDVKRLKTKGCNTAEIRTWKYCYTSVLSRITRCTNYFVGFLFSPNR